MKLGKIKSIFLAFLAVVMLTVLCSVIAVTHINAYAGETTGYEGAYRNKLAFSAKQGWNNDPNGLLYVNGVWHMYYQYNWDETHKKTENQWGHMSWGHAISSDLVHWEERPVAIPEGQQGYAMMFSGSAVYDENNTSGFFDTDPDGKVVDGQGIIAVLTQPSKVQRQILAYSKDNGESFTIHGEVIGADNDGGIGDNEFRDPKVFRSEKLNKWLMVVGGGSVRMYSSDNLKDWQFLGQTGYWGECPDISRYEVDGDEKYVLIISPEDKPNSHVYNKTNRADTYYPAEYYVVGDLDETGLFVSNDPIRRLSEGIDSYAFQSFNNSPDGKVYGVSWSASWKTCGLYEGYRKTHNGGMTVITQLELVKEDGDFVLTRNPVEEYSDLRDVNKLIGYSGKLAKGDNALAGVSADVADLEIELDFSGGNATSAELLLRVSAIEKIKISYTVADGILMLDRSQSSLLAKDTALYTVPYLKRVDLKDGKLSLRILLDRAFISVFAEGGKASFFSAVFPSAVSNGMSLTADGDIDVKADVYKLNGIFTQNENDELVLTTDKIDGVVGKTYPVVLSSFGEKFNADEVRFTVVDGAQNVRIEQSGEIAYMTPLTKGYAKVRANYKDYGRDIDVFIYNDKWVSQVEYLHRVGGFSFYGEDGLFLADDGDGFRFSETKGENFVYSAEFIPENYGAQAAGLVFGVSDNLTNYWVATADTRDKKVKLWQSGVGDLKTAHYEFEAGTKFKITVAVNGDTVKIFINDSNVAAIYCKLNDFSGGKLGLNVFNGGFHINNVEFAETDLPDVSDVLRFGKLEGENFIYSAEFAATNVKAQTFGLVFGASDLTSYFAVTADVWNGKIEISHSQDGVLKTVDYLFVLGMKYKLTVVMNADAVKLFINDNSVAIISCKLEGYSGGRLGLKYGDDFKAKVISFTDTDLPEGDIYCNGYDVIKVVNISDGNYKLKDGEYTVESGVLKVSPEYLRTLESYTEYTFRAVTSFTDFDFKIKTDFTAVTVNPAVEKYYRDNNVTLELSGNVKVHKLLIDGKECEFTQEEGVVIISSKETSSLSTGGHVVKLYTDKGRPETTITVSEIVETVTEPAVKTTHVFLWIDVAIFLSAIIGYTAFSIISKRKKK